MTASKTILVVDDDPDILEQLKLVLSGDGYEVVAAGSHQEAEELLVSMAPDLAIVDLMMEEKDSGFVLCHQIRKLHPNTAVIILTAVRAATGLSFEAQSPAARSWVQADCVIDKPVRPEFLRNKVRQLLDA